MLLYFYFLALPEDDCLRFAPFTCWPFTFFLPLLLGRLLAEELLPLLLDLRLEVDAAVAAALADASRAATSVLLLPSPPPPLLRLVLELRLGLLAPLDLPPLLLRRSAAALASARASAMASLRASA